jgi:hypothetical protein
MAWVPFKELGKVYEKSLQYTTAFREWQFRREEKEREAPGRKRAGTGGQ